MKRSKTAWLVGGVVLVGGLLGTRVASLTEGDALQTSLF